MKAVSNLRVDKSAVTISRLMDSPDEKSFWVSQSPYERLKAVETLRQINYGYRQSTARLQRVFEIAQRTPR